METAAKFTFSPKGPFNLLNQNLYFGGWISPAENPAAIVMTFPVEGWQGSAAVMLRQLSSGKLEGQVLGPSKLTAKATEQALATLSLNVDGEKWPEVGRLDNIIGQLQKKYDYLRPVLFQSPYEAAVAFIIGHRISIRQRRVVMQRMAEELGEKIEVQGQTYHAFPLPQQLISLEQFNGINDIKTGELHVIGQAALDGFPDRRRLLSLSVEEALAKLKGLPGIGPFYSQGILYRGAGMVDDITDDETSR